MSNSLPAGVIRIHLDTTGRFSAQLAGQIIASMAESIERNPEIGTETSTALMAAGEGSWWAQILIITGTVIGSAGVVVAAAEALATDVREGRTPFGRAVPAALEEGDGRTATICADDIEIRITVDQMMAYPPPVGEEPIDWVLGTKGAARRDWAQPARYPALVDVFAMLERMGDLNSRNLKPNSDAIEREWRETWERHGRINFSYEPEGTNLLVLRGTYVGDFPLAAVDTSDGVVLLQGISSELDVKEGEPVTVVGVEQSRFEPINAILIDPVSLIKAKHRY